MVHIPPTYGVGEGAQDWNVNGAQCAEQKIRTWRSAIATTKLCQEGEKETCFSPRLDVVR